MSAFDQVEALVNETPARELSRLLRYIAMELTMRGFAGVGHDLVVLARHLDDDCDALSARRGVPAEEQLPPAGRPGIDD